MSEEAAEVLYFQFFAWSAIPWVPEVLSARHAFVTSLSQAGKADRISETLCENTFSFVLIFFYLTGILFFPVKAVRNILQVSLRLLHKILLEHPEENHQVIEERTNKTMRFIEVIFGKNAKEGLEKIGHFFSICNPLASEPSEPAKATP